MERKEVVVLGCESGFSSKNAVSYETRLYYQGKDGRTKIAVAEGKNQAGAMSLACRKMLEEIGAHLNGATLVSSYLTVEKNSNFRYDLEWSLVQSGMSCRKMSVGADKDLTMAVLKAVVNFLARFQDVDIWLDFSPFKSD